MPGEGVLSPGKEYEGRGLAKQVRNRESAEIPGQAPGGSRSAQKACRVSLVQSGVTRSWSGEGRRKGKEWQGPPVSPGHRGLLGPGAHSLGVGVLRQQEKQVV